MQITSKPLKGAMVRQYFDRLATIFWASENHLLHAHALYRLFDKSSSLKACTQDELAAMGSQLLVATLCVPRHENRKASAQYYDFDIDRDRGLRLSSLLGLSSTLDCKVLLQELVARGVPTIVSPEVSDLHTLLLMELDPLELCERARPVLAALADTYKQYVPALKRTICVQLLGQLGEVYQAMQMSSLESMVTGIVTMQEMEQLIVEAVRNNQIQARLDYQTMTLRFGGEGAEYEDIRWQVSTLSHNLQRAMYIVNPELQAEEEESKQRHLNMLKNELRQEHERVLARKGEIEERKEQHEKDMQRREKEEQLRKEEKEAQEAIKERARLDKEAERREDARRAKEDEERDRQEALAKAAKVKALSDKSLEELQGMSIQDLEAEQRRASNKQREEREHKLTIAARRLDYIERARRITEKPLLLKAIEERKQLDKEYFEQHQAAAAARHEQEWKDAIQTKQAISVMVQDQQEYQQQLSEIRQTAFQQLLEHRRKEWEANVEQERLDRRQRRREEKARRKAEAERQARLQAEREEREEQERLDREAREKEMEQRMADRAEREASLNAQAEVQRRREEEIMAKQQSLRGRGGDEAPSSGRWGGGRPQGDGGERPSWRDREAGRDGGRFGGRDERPPPSRWGGSDDRPSWRDRGADREEPPREERRWGGRDNQSSYDRRDERGDGGRFGGGGSRWGGDRDRDGGERRWGGPRDNDRPRDDGGDRPRWQSSRDRPEGRASEGGWRSGR